ncbi:MAG: cell division protein FtsQ/DivIB [Candidatus Berkelbacteria bacterium]|nr:cell division protein FtsQ/DivIB [Candidatus Berkelbacteria bacterium]
MALRRSPRPYFGRSPQIYLSTPRDRKKVKPPYRLFKFILLLLIIGALAYLAFFSPYFLIKNVLVKGPTNESIVKLSDSAKGKNLWLFDSKKLRGDLLKIGEISQVSISKLPLGTLKINIVQKSEGIIWQTQGKKYLLDQQGFAIKEINESSLPSVVDQKNASIELGKQIVNPAFISFVKDLNFKFSPKTNLPIKEISVPAETTFELILQTEGFKVIFDTQGNLDQQLDNMVRVYQVKKDEIKEYMDLRIEGRVYYK